MQLKMFSIRDSKAEIYNRPFFTHTLGEAEREFTRISNDPQSQISQFPEDYDLYYVGTYDDNSGKFTTLPTPEHITKAVSVQRN